MAESADTEALPGAIGPYRVKSLLGKGGMGAVYEAVHETLERRTALKILPPQFHDDPTYKTRFLREARVVASLKHDNIVQVYDAGEVNDCCFIAMELVDGVSLAKYVEERGALPEKEGLQLMLQAAKGLAAAHEKGLVHRDIKPENLLLGKDGTLRLVDFGLVREASNQTQLTVAGSCMGTPMYMSPEQCDGEATDARTDLYSLGATFYRILTGQAPFTSTSTMQLLFHHKFDAPRDPRLLQKALSKDTAYLLLTLLQKKPERRPESAARVRELIEGIKKGRHIPKPPPIESSVATAAVTVEGPARSTAKEPVEITPPPARPSKAARKTARRGLPVWLWALPAAAATAAVVGGGLYWAFFRQPPAPVPSVSAADKKRATEEISKGEAAEKEGNYEAAQACYRRAKQADPDNPRCKQLLDRARDKSRARKLKAEAEKLKHDGRWAEAADRAEEAAKLDASWAEFARKLRREKQGRELQERAAKAFKAEAWLKAQNLYRQAAQTADDPTERALLESRAEECAAKAKLATAEVAMTSQQNYRRYFLNGEKALKDGLYQSARKWFEAAAKENPAAKVMLRGRMDEASAREHLQKGDEARRKGNLNEARREYRMVSNNWPLFTPQAQARLAALDRKPVEKNKTPKGEKALEHIRDLIRRGHLREALDELDRLPAGDAEKARELRRGTERLDACNRIYDELQRVLDEALVHLAAVQRVEESAGVSRLVRDFRDMKTRYNDKKGLVPGQLLAKRYSAVEGSMLSARNDAHDVQSECRRAAGLLDAKAAKYRTKFSVKLPWVKKIEVGKGDEAKKRRFQEAADAFRALARRAELLRR